jgi:hypothetical protein
MVFLRRRSKSRYMYEAKRPPTDPLYFTQACLSRSFLGLCMLYGSFTLPRAMHAVWDFSAVETMSYKPYILDSR